MESSPPSNESNDLSSLAVEIVHAVYSYRFLTLPQVATLFQRDIRTTQLALTRLVDAGYLAEVRRPVLDADAPDTVYALAQRGANLVASRLGIESHVRFAGKIRRYLAYKESRLFRYRYGGRSFRILIVAPTWTRARALKRVTEAEGGGRMFWFASLQRITRDRIGEPVWEMAGVTGAKARLFSHTDEPVAR